MANTIKQLESFKRGDTPTFRFEFTSPYDGFDWTTITVDAAFTAVEFPTNNSGAAALRLDQPVVEFPTGAYFEFTLTPTESNALKTETEYKVEAKLKSESVVVTPVTCKVRVLQDYII